MEELVECLELQIIESCIPTASWIDLDVQSLQTPANSGTATRKFPSFRAKKPPLALNNIPTALLLRSTDMENSSDDIGRSDGAIASTLPSGSIHNPNHSLPSLPV